jgi:multiple sugar transport system permease protein
MSLTLVQGRRWPRRTTRSLRRMIEPWLYLSPALVLLFVVLLIPLIVGIGYSFRRFSAFRSEYVGLDQYRAMLQDPALGQALYNTVWWTAGSLVFQFGLGLGLALLLNRQFNPIIGPIPHWLFALGLQAQPRDLLSDPHVAMWGPIIANVWFGVPFFAITLLAALKSIPSELYEAAALDGAGVWQRFLQLTVPFLAPTIAITIMLRTIWIATFADLIFVMTGGGPAGSTNTVATYVYVSAFRAMDKGYAAAVAVLLLVLLVVYAVVLITMRRRLLPQ